MTPDGVLTIFALLFVAACFALATGLVALGIVILSILAVAGGIGCYWLTRDPS